MGAKLKLDTIVVKSCCPTCGQTLQDGPDALIRQDLKKHGNGGFIRGCRCEECVISYRTYQRNYQRKYYRNKLSKTGRFSPDQEEPLRPMTRDKNGRFQ